MKVWRGDPRFWGPGPAGGMALTIGVFDGLHRGHQDLLSRLAARARPPSGFPIGVVTFDVHPRALLAPDQAPKTLMPVGRRLELLASMGVDQVGILPFEKVSRLAPDEFVRRVVVGGFNAHLVIVGAGFRYGAGRKGSAATLRESGERRGFAVEVRDLLRAGSIPVSSSMIRKYVARGEVAAAADLLGRPHELTATRRLGGPEASESGIPFVDVEFDQAMATPSPGVYAVRVNAGGDRLPGICLIPAGGRAGDPPPPARVHVPDRLPSFHSGPAMSVCFVDLVRGLSTGREDPARASVIRRTIRRARELLDQHPEKGC